MKKIYIVTDSTADLNKEEIARYGIHIVPLTVQLDGETLVDGVDVDRESFLERMSDARDIPKSSQPAVGVFQELYETLGNDGSEIISIHMTGGMSGTVKTARIAAEASGVNVTVIDSMYITHALSFQVLEAAEMAAKGKTPEEIVERLSVIRAQTTLYVVVDQLDHLVKGGRIGKGRGLIGSLLNIKPIATLQDGVYTPVAQVRSYRQVVKYLLKALTEETTGKVIRGIGISHADGLAMAEPLKIGLEKMGIQNVRVSVTSPIISTHTGKGAVGFMYYAEPDGSTFT